jgi:hypothetical protein
VRVAAALHHGRVGRLLLALSLTFAMAACWTATAADAYTTAGPRWPGRVAKITYWNGTNFKAELNAAVNAWNNSGARVRFVRARRSRAKLRITTTNTPANDGGFGAWGIASIGYGSNNYVRLGRRTRGGAALTGVIAHELGHVLGLGHEDGACALLNSVPWAMCDRQKPCSILQEDDVRGAIRRYGGRLRAQPGVLCPPAPIAPTIDLIPGSYRAQARFKMPSALSVAGYAVAVGIGECPITTPESAPSWTARAGQDITFDVTPFQDPHAAAGKELCAKIWTLGEGGRVSAQPAVAQKIYAIEPVAPPSGLTIERVSDGIIASWPESTHQAIRSYDLTWHSDGSCPKTADDVSLIQRETVMHPATTLRVGLAAGTYCFALWSRDRFSVPSATASTAVVTVGG